MAAYKKYRKAPKKSASLDVQQNYLAHVKEVDKHNAQIDKDKAQKTKVLNDIKKAKAKK